MRFLERRERHENTRAASWVAFYLYFSAMIFDDLMRDGQA
jgi:hypothetical protein